MRFVGSTVVAISLLILPSTLSGQRAPVLPVDEAVRDPEFFVFRARLQAALAAHDTSELMRIVSPDILNSFGGDGGRDEFREKWNIAEPEKSKVWVTLGMVLGLGGSFFTDSTFAAPYLVNRTPGDGFEVLAVLGKKVFVRAGPSLTSTPIDTLSFETVTMWREKSSTNDWEPVRTARGRTGWVLTRYLRSPITYRAGFRRHGGRWWMSSLVAGD